MKIKLFEEYIRFFTDDRKVRIMDFIYNKLKEIYEGDDMDYNAHKNPNDTWDFTMDNDDIYLYVETFATGLPTMEVEFTIRNVFNGEDWEDEELGIRDDIVNSPSLPFSRKIHGMIKKLVRKKKKEKENRDIRQALDDIGLY